MKKVMIGSKNPLKIEAVKEAFSTMLSENEENFVFESKDISSEVSDQPFSEEETYRGALNRAINSFQQSNDVDYGVGIEGGIEEINGNYFTFAWIIIKSKEGIGESRTHTLKLPQKVKELLDEGYELGHANDKIFSCENSKQKGGALGILSHGILDRKTAYIEGTKMALIPFKNKDLYFN